MDKSTEYKDSLNENKSKRKNNTNR